jgi:uncharacterized protein YjiS (DUF1127 family)
MTTTYADQTAPSGTTSSTGATPPLAIAMSHLRTWLRERRTRRELLALPSRMLADIGISRSEVDSIIGHGRTGRAPVGGRGFR